MRLFKIQKWHFCEKLQSNFKFSSIKKENYCIEKQEKLSILEYFNIIPRNKYSNPQQSLLKEIILFVNSDNFQKEFKYSLTNENRIFKFYILNVSLLSHRIEEVKKDSLFQINYFKIKNFVKYFTKDTIDIFLINIYFKYFPLHFVYENFYNEYSKNYILKESFQEIFTEKFFKKMKKLDIKYLRYRTLFSLELNKLNRHIEEYFHDEKNIDKKFEDLLKEDEDFNKKYDSFLKKYFIGFIFEINLKEKDKSKNKNINFRDEVSIYSKDVDKLFTYFLAHVIPFLIYYYMSYLI